MSLSQYKKKRTSSATPEPFGGEANKDALVFVIQKHAASHLHYDFRLEMGGVLKSWAVPKGPSTDPSVKRLAMMVEDHPYDYKNFEGNIPKGQYGGGTVMLWDEGVYEPIEDIKGKEAQNKNLLQQLKSGSLKIRLKGEKLKGEFALVKTKGVAENAWLLIKHKDEFAGETDITKKDTSVRSGKTMAQISKAITNVEEKKAPVTTAKKKATAKEASSSDASLLTLLKAGSKKRFSTAVSPMLATLVDEAFDAEGWTYEIKWDGYRALAFKNKQTLELSSRNNKSFNSKFYPVLEALELIEADVVIDGEVVVLTKEGKADFAALQNWKSPDDGELHYFVFDLLWCNGVDLTQLGLEKRREILRLIMPKDSILQYSSEVESSGIKFLEAAKKMGLEGIMAKKKNSLYYPGKRTEDWLKIKANKRQELMIGGYSVNKDTSKPFSALLLGVYQGKKFVYIGKVGTGFSIKDQKEMLEQFKAYVSDKTAFDELPDIFKKGRFQTKDFNVVWMKPVLLCEVSYSELTQDGLLRHPSFQGMRQDKSATAVVLEKEQKSTAMVKEKLKTKAASTKKTASKAKNNSTLLLDPDKEEQVKTVQGKELTFTNLDKLYWPKEKVSKRDLIEYYHQMAEYILPYLRYRPQSLNRFPDGIEGISFYQKDVSGKVPDWTDTYLYHSEDDKRDKHFLLGNNKPTLLLMAGLGCIELHPWNSTIKKPDHPTWCVIDIDPDKQSFDKVILAAQTTKDVLDDLGIEGYCKTSGSTGIHIYIPLGNKYSYDQSKEFARIIAALVNKELPKFTTLERSINKRQGKMYLDFLQNRAQATLAAPYSLRAKPGATVSMPIHWDELKKGLTMKDFTIANALERVKAEGDIFKRVLGKGIDLNKVVKSFEER